MAQAQLRAPTPLVEREQKAIAAIEAVLYADEDDTHGGAWADCSEVDVPVLLDAVKRLVKENQTLEARRAYGADIINDMTLEAGLAQQQLAAAEAGWTDLRVVAAGMRRNASYALDQWEGEERTLEDLEQQEVKKLLVEISDTTWPIPRLDQL
ncbi:hypothetical protein [Hymenobacter sp. PAMC 26628]|uniref:hypothetical protein n=1 Tax=Hymenobacter sp. PAMC 26628 TaxID=1484118 RepID=UPI0007704168|nr:hypothetical protein [Hymenobacter sp. PAMC 26628]AMJ65028.1 hypothetical protein AXW84_06005 [Hymenobacter sp. PAMC 26628]